MTTAIIGTGGIGSAVARQLAAGGEALQLSSADEQSARKTCRDDRRSRGRRCRQPERIAGCRRCHPCAAVFRFKDVIDEIADALGDTSLVVPSNPVGLDAQGKVVRLLPEGQSSGQVVARWLPTGTRFAIAFGTMSADLFESSSHRSPEPAVLFYVSEDKHGSDEVERLDPNGWL